jgi:hypothetical protein
VTHPIDDLRKAVNFMHEIGTHGTQVRELVDRLADAEQLNREAFALLKYGPKHFGGQAQWMAARDAWLRKAGW